MNDIPAGEHRLTSHDWDVLNALRHKLRQHFTRVWPGREHPSCPPALAAALHPLYLRGTSLEPPDSEDHTVVVLLPSDWAAHLATLDTEVVWRVQRDVAQRTKRAYASWTCRSPGVPRSIWLGLSPLMHVMWANTPPECAHPAIDSWGAPVWFVCRERAVRRDVGIHIDIRAQLRGEVDAPLDDDESFERGLECCSGVTYEGGYQPWLHARHELLNAAQRLDVLLAPLAVPGECHVHSSVSPLAGLTLD